MTANLTFLQHAKCVASFTYIRADCELGSSIVLITKPNNKTWMFEV